jgi:transposase-like protein
MGKKSELTVEERTEVVLALLRKEEPAAALSRRYQVSEQTLYRWRDQFPDLSGASQLIRFPAGRPLGAVRRLDAASEVIPKFRQKQLITCFEVADLP